MFEGTLYTWGANDKGQLGRGHTLVQAQPGRIKLANISSISCGSWSSFAITKEGNKEPTNKK